MSYWALRSAHLIGDDDPRRLTLAPTREQQSEIQAVRGSGVGIPVLPLEVLEDGEEAPVCLPLPEWLKESQTR